MYGEPFETIPVEKLAALFRTANTMHTSRVNILKAHYICELLAYKYKFYTPSIQSVKAYYL